MKRNDTQSAVAVPVSTRSSPRLAEQSRRDSRARSSRTAKPHSDASGIAPLRPVCTGSCVRRLRLHHAGLVVPSRRQRRWDLLTFTLSWTSARRVGTMALRTVPNCISNAKVLSASLVAQLFSKRAWSTASTRIHV